MEGEVSARLGAGLGNFLQTLECTNVDEAVLEYAAGVLQTMVEDKDGEDDQDNLEHLDSLLAGACGERYESAAEGERHFQLAMIVQEARQEVKATPVAPTCTVAPAPSSSTLPAARSVASAADAAACQLRGLAVSSSDSLLGSGGGSGISSSGGSAHGGRENVSPAGEVAGSHGGSGGAVAAAAVRELSAMCSGAVSDGFLWYALERKFAGSSEAAAEWLLDAGPDELQAAEAEWEGLREREVQAQEEARLLKVRNKQHILSKFDLQPIALLKDPKKGVKGGTAPDAFIGKDAAQTKVRYLDGRVVSQKGEKFIIEKVGEEWDGGSRGKVYTKGKRGKGFS